MILDTGTDVKSSFFVPHDLASPIIGAQSGPLAGLAAAVKDMYDIAGAKTGCGNPAWLAVQEPAKTHAVVIDKILSAGATIVGKTICDEFFCSIVGKNAHYGMPMNVRAPGRIPGGSSSGSAAATAANACDFALGSDTGGSIRVPASLCGIYGLRPTHGRIDVTGMMPMAPTFDVCGFFANAAGIMRRVGAVLLDGEPVNASVKELVVAEDALALSDPSVAKLCRLFLARSSRELPTGKSIYFDSGSLEQWREALRIVQGFEMWKTFGDFLTEADAKLGAGIKERMKFGSSISDQQANAARTIVNSAREYLHNLLKPGTIMVLPTTPCIAPRIDMTDDEAESYRVRAMRLTCIAGVGGLPQINIPVGTVDGCPAGLSLIGWENGDETLLNLACILAKFCGIAC